MGKTICKEGDQGVGQINGFFASASVLPGNIYKVSGDIKSNASFISTDFRVNLVDNDTGIVLRQKDLVIDPGESKSFSFDGRMQNKDANLNLSLIDLNSLWWDTCEDYRDFTIRKAESAADESINPLVPTGISKYLLYGVVGIVIILFIIFLLRR